MKMKIVADTNLFVAANYNPNSASAQVLNMVARRDLILVWSEEIAEEIYKIMDNAQVKDKFKKKVRNRILRPEHLVEPSQRIKEIKEDPDDNKFLEAAVEGDVDYIISSDHHLLKIRKFQDIPILMPTNFWQVIKG